MAMCQKLVNNIFIDTQFACKGTSTKSQKQFPKTRFTYLCIQNYITNMNQDYIISSVINFQAFDVLCLAKYGALSKTFIKVSFRMSFPSSFMSYIYCDKIL